MKPKTHIGIEIEVNDIFGLKISNDVWAVDSEHCGYELRSMPAKSPKAIRKLLKSIKVMKRDSVRVGTGFNNTGTHVHIDFLNDGANKVDLQRRQAKYNKDKGRWRNPTGTGKKYYWLDRDGKNWASPNHYMSKMSNTLVPSDAYVSQNKRFIQSVKRFMLIGVRFSNLLFALQHPSRRFNKYCHSLGGWSEEILMECSSVHRISTHNNLLQSHRRHMFNTLSFRKFGTVEVRMIRGSLNADEIWRQIYLFGKLAQLAKSNKLIPKSTGNISADFIVLFNAAGIRGKMRKRLIASVNQGKNNWTARCFSCEGIYPIEYVNDFGLSRPICDDCHGLRDRCILCGYIGYRTNDFGDSSFHYVDDKGPDGRSLCYQCSGMSMAHEKINKTLSIMGIQVGSGFDNQGPNTLRKLRDVFSKD